MMFQGPDALIIGITGLVYFGAGVFLICLAWRAVKALEASARAQHDVVVALRTIAANISKGEN